MLTIQIIDHETGASAIAEIPSAFAPAFRSAVTEIRQELGERLAGAHKYGKESSLTRAVAAIGALAAAINKVITSEDRDYA